jgi:hypothetical protein
MKIDEIQIAGEPLVLATDAEIHTLESLLWIDLPDGYRDYVTRLGEGTLGSFIRVYPPWRIEHELTEWRRRIGKYWFWDEGRALLPKERALECMIVGDTLNGDELIFHPTRRGHLFVLPRDSEQVFEAGDNLLQAIEWMCRSGELIDEFPGLEFEPFDSRQQMAEGGRDSASTADPDGESLDSLVGMGKRWVERHSARKTAEQQLKKQVSDLAKQFGKERTSAFLYEAFVLDGKNTYEPGYLAVFRIDDKAARLEVGRFTWHQSDDSRGGEFVPNHANLAQLAKPN